MTTADRTEDSEGGDERPVTARVYRTEAEARAARATLFNGPWLYSVLPRAGGYAVVENAESATRFDYE